MKKNIAIMALTALFSFAFVSNNYAQDQWYQGRSAGIYSVGIGGTDAIGVGGIYSNNNIYGYRISPITPVGMSLNASGEYKVYKFIGVGWQTGLDFLNKIRIGGTK